MSGAALVLTPAVGPPTAVVRASGAGFGAEEAVDLAFDGAMIAHAMTDPDGSFSSTVTVPRSALPGDHVVSATGETSGSSASADFLVRTFPQTEFIGYSWILDDRFRSPLRSSSAGCGRPR
jgi:hypothetical protein